jgi:pyruvate/2-oxoglutarate/acetoin dehydrogenase E1 component/TPP-dependent pyruvate/acetoin dehydrogenase alpha subunit
MRFKLAITKEFPLTKDQIIEDYKTAFISRQASLLGRKEVLAGKAKFGIFGDGKEIAQVAMARAFQKGDWRAGYYRDQTFMLAIGEISVQSFFAQLYADTNLENEPASGGRQMNSHFATRYYDRSTGEWSKQANEYNVASDLSPTAGQMAKLVGLGYASKLYRNSDALIKSELSAHFSTNGNEVAFGTIGNASTSEGHFWESINAAGVLQIPLAMNVWDDGYGISVEAKYQTTKSSISKVLSGFQNDDGNNGYEIYTLKGWDYPSLVETYLKGIEKCRKEHNPALFHIEEITQPQGHSTSGSHERYKSAERLQWEVDFDGITRMKHWLIENGVADEAEIGKLESEAINFVEESKQKAWDAMQAPLIDRKSKADTLIKNLLESMDEDHSSVPTIEKILKELNRSPGYQHRAVHVALRKIILLARDVSSDQMNAIHEFEQECLKIGRDCYNSYLYVENEKSPETVSETPKIISDSSKKVDGRQVIQAFFDKTLADDPRVFIIGEDVGQLGGVNLEFEGLNEKHGELRVTNTGIREATILGQGQGAAMRGLRPIVDIQYLDYLLYCLQGISDDVATLHYRSAGGQVNPLIIRTKGHRLEGIWHTGSPIGMILNSIKGVHFCVPRNMVQAAGMYKTLLQGDDPAVVIEVLNGYRVKEVMPDNVGEYSIPLGKVETLREGNDITVVTYGACCRVAEDACKQLEELGISVELIDVQTLSPFDKTHDIRKSLEKTNALIVMDEDVPGGASSFILQEALETQNGYDFLDAMPKTVTASPNRSSYGSEADYYCKPSAEDLVDAAFEVMSERKPYLFSR